MLGASVLALSACMVGPSYKRPSAPVSARFKELKPAAGWEYANPKLADAPKGKWWMVYNDPQLNALEEQVAINNQNVVEYDARYRAARAQINSVRAQLFPTLSGSFSANRNAQGGGSQNAASGSIISSSTGYTKNTYTLSSNASWDPDIWGKVRRQIQAQVTESQGTAADLAYETLSYQAQLAVAYFNLHYQDSLHALLDRNVQFYKKALQITQNQADAGTSDPTAALQARYQLEQTQASETATETLRAQYEHSIAVMVGKAPADVSIPVSELAREIPPIPVDLPVTLLQRRPDIAAAERRMEEYNADIGAAIAAFYPSFALSASYEQSGDPIGTLMDIGNRIWSLGASATETLFEGGSRTAAVHEANANYDYYVASYRQTVLTALQNTEDQLANLRVLAVQAKQQDVALSDANRAVTLEFNQYEAGIVAYTSVITNEQNALSIAETALQIQQSRMVDSVDLIEALGGGWSADQLPTKASMQTDNPFLPSFIQKDKN